MLSFILDIQKNLHEIFTWQGSLASSLKLGTDFVISGSAFRLIL